ncbi:MAG: hypothetical protein CR966_00220 [Pseudomonadales bacterium]|nr:MAG: hypothetical protein CR966_00220 [Pseudomonadales bacterium]
MTNKNNKFLKYGHLSLGVAVSSILLTACAGSQVRPPVTKNSAILQPNGNYQYGAGAINGRGLLDEESLAELADLLEAQDMTMVENDQNTINQVGDLWNKIRNGYGIQRIDAYHPRIEAQKSWFMYNQDHLNKMTARASRYLYYTVSEAERRGIPLEFALLPIIESSYDPSVTSKAKAAGIWQFIPSTGRMYGLKQTSDYDARRDVIKSTEAAYSYLASLYNQFGDWELALAAYNAGPTRVQRAINANRKQGKPTDFWSLDLPKETMNYVPRFLAVNEIVSNPTAHNLYLPAIANKQHLHSIPVAVGVKLSDVAIVSGVPLMELQNLNAGMLSGKVERNTPQRVIVPASVNESQIAQIQSLTKDNINSLIVNNPNNGGKPFISKKSTVASNPKNSYRSTYVVQPNDTLESVAKRAGITPRQLAQWNDLSPNAILLPNTRLSLYDAKYLPANQQKRYTSSNTQKTRPQYYTVRAGDTLTGTARKFGLSTRQLASYNNLSANALVRIGQRLWLIPGKVKVVATNKTKTVARPTIKNSKYNNTTRYQVQSGETLSGIARRHHTTVSTLASLNGVDVNYKVKWGEYLVVPTGKTPALSNVSARTTSCSTPTRSKRAPLKVMSTAKNARVAKYKVRSGDTLTSVANSFGLSIHDLAAANGLSVNSQLKRYSTITIPAASCPEKSAKAKPIKAKKSKQASKSRVTHVNRRSHSTGIEKYRVQSGDSLTALARKYNVSVPELARLNQLSTTTDLLIGQTIKVPSNGNSSHGNSGKYTVRSGDSLTNLANRYNVSIQKLAKLNGLSTDAMLRIGQVIKVPR